MEETLPLHVDLDQVLRDKNPRMARLMPGFVKSYLKRIVHQNDLNYILDTYAHLSPVEFIRGTFEHLGISYDSQGLENLDPQGRYLFASNHPFGGMDGMMLLDELDRYFGSGRIIVNDILMNLKPLAPLFIPINKHGKQNTDYARQFQEALQSPGQIATFPAGLCSRRYRGEICDPTWKTSFIKNAINSKRDIVPVFFEGNLSPFFYNLFGLRTKLGVKANIEMLYLVNELFKQRNKHFNILYGTPVAWEEIAAGGSPKTWTETVKSRVYALNNGKSDR